MKIRTDGHPGGGRVPRWRLDVTGTGFLLEVEEEWHDKGQHWYCREMIRCDVTDGEVSAISIYCTGDWDEATVARHAESVPLIRSLTSPRGDAEPCRTDVRALRCGHGRGHR